MNSSVFVTVCIVLMIIVIIICCSAVYQAEKEKRAALEREINAKTEFLSKISYDIRTPMNAIIGTAALGMEEVDDPEKMRECLSKISSSSQFLMGLLNDLVDMSRIENGKFLLHPVSYAYGDFIDEIWTMIEPNCRKKEIRLEMPPDDININLEVDKLRFKQLFFNLLSNAVKFTQKGGYVSFKVCNYATHNNIFSADYIVEDNGIGMSREFQQILFLPFTQETERRAERKNGTGLGLAIVRNIVDLMNGTIEVESTVGEGTKIKVHLDIPLAGIQPEKTENHRNADDMKRILRGKRVLLAEDHPLNVEITKRMLEKQEMQVVCAENGQVASKLFESQPEYFFDVILMDIKMPVMDGLEATRRIRHIPHSDAQIIPIFAMTADCSESDRNFYREMGMNAYVEKPVEPQKLYQLLCEYLENA